MTTIKKRIGASVVAHSVNILGTQIATLVVECPRIVLAEFNTHRMFSRKSASSRAVPFNKMLQRVEEDPFIPIAWQKDHKGMQGTEYFTHEEVIRHHLVEHWLDARDLAAQQAKLLSEDKVTKQLCNRLLEPFMWHTILVTATQWENFFSLRCPQYKLNHYIEMRNGSRVCDEVKKYRSKKDWISVAEKENPNHPIPLTDLEWLNINESQAEIHFQAVSEAIYDALKESKPRELNPGDWHIPFGDNLDHGRIAKLMVDDMNDGKLDAERVHDSIDIYRVKVATARSARVSYLNFEGKDDYQADVKLHDDLKNSGHWSPFEHCAQAMGPNDRGMWSGNFKGFIQYRKNFDNENAGIDG